jgi:opacity protein-like surface antigen
MRRLTILLGLVLALPFAAAAQDSSKFELFGGYNYTHISDGGFNAANSNGGTADVGYFPIKWVGLVGTVAYSHSNGFTNPLGTFFTAPTNSLSYLAGPRIRFSTGRFTPYVETLFGGVHRSNFQTSTGLPIDISGPETSFASFVGGGLDFKLTHHISVRVVQLGYLHTTFRENGPPTPQNDFNLSTGIVIRIP